MNDKKSIGRAGGFASIRWAYAGISLFLIALGIFSVARPDIGINAVCIAIGAASGVFGIIQILVYFTREVKGVALTYDFSVGALCVVAGVILLVRPSGVIDLLQVIIGIYLLADSVFKLQTALDAKRIGISGWWISLLFTLISLTFGILMVLKVGADLLMVITGVALIADGLQNLCLVIFSSAAAKALAKREKGNSLIDINNAGNASPSEATTDAEQPVCPVQDTVTDEEGSIKT